MRHMNMASCRWAVATTLLVVLLVFVGVPAYVLAQDEVPEVSLKIGEPWEDMRKRSTAEVAPTITDTSAFGVILSDARMRFLDSQYGFLTPRARFFTISYREEKVESVRMSPQVEPLLLDDALKVVLDLQDQWRNGGWKPVITNRRPSFADTPQWRKDLEACKSNTTYWQIPNLYQTQLILACFDDANHPNEKRYLITLELSSPYVEEADADVRQLRPYRRPQP